MTGRRNDAVSRWAAAALAALLLFGALGLSGCAALDPDGGASLAVAKEYAPIPIKINVLESMKAQGFAISNFNNTYVTYPSLPDTATVVVAGLMYGPSGKEGVLDIYKGLKLTLLETGAWKVAEATKGTPDPEPGEAEAAGEASGSAESTATTTTK